MLTRGMLWIIHTCDAYLCLYAHFPGDGRRRAVEPLAIRRQLDVRPQRDGQVLVVQGGPQIVLRVYPLQQREGWGWG